MNNKIMPTSALILWAAAMLLAGSIDLDEELEKNDKYCEMVATYQETKGDYGWPDYNNNYYEVCK